MVEAAGQLAAEVGFSNVSTRAIAERAGENIGSIHYHFGSKEKLFEQVIRKAIRRAKENPVSDVLKPFEDRLDSPQVQSQAVRAVVHRYIKIVFNPDAPKWHKRVIYQVLIFSNPLKSILMKEMGEPDSRSIANLVKKINPKLSQEDALLHTFIIQAPIIFHSHFIDPILGMLEKEDYGSEYLQKMEDIITGQTQMLLALPTDKKIE